MTGLDIVATVMGAIVIALITVFVWRIARPRLQ